MDATLRKHCRRHPYEGADGVVRNVFNHPVCAFSGGFAPFSRCAATPPLEEGNSSRFAISPFGHKPRHERETSWFLFDLSLLTNLSSRQQFSSSDISLQSHFPEICA